MEICRIYVLYVRRVNDVITGGEKARSTVVQAFDFAVNKVGVDLDSYDLWKDYVDFFKGWNPGSNWELQQKTDLIRKLYRRCLVIPNAKIETMWADYRKWENEVSNPNSASKFIADLSTAYMEVRPWTTEWLNATENQIRRKLVPHSPYDDPSDIVANQVTLWFRWVELEKKNKLKLNDSALQHRIEYVYRRATSMLPFAAEIWFRFGQYLLSIGEEKNRGTCVALFADALILNPTSFLLAFQLSELYEKESSFDKARDVYEKLIKILTEKHETIQAQLDSLKSKAAEAIKSVASGDSGKDTWYDDNDDEPAPLPVIAYTEVQASEIESVQKQLEELANSVTLLFIKLMSLCKRSQGIKEARSIFKQRKSFKDIGHQFYVQNALHEYYSDNKKTADKVFDLAMKSFCKNGAFLYAYLEYLILSNSIESLKVIFEVAVTLLLKEIANDTEVLEITTHNLVLHNEAFLRLKKSQIYLKKIVRRYITFASTYLDLDTVLSLSKRYVQYFPETDDLTLFSDRYKLNSLNLIAKYDLAEKLENIDDLDELDQQSQLKKRKYESLSSEPSTVGRSDGLPLPLMPSIVVNAPQQHGFVGDEIYTLLQYLPNAGYFGPQHDHLFNSTKLVELFSDAVLPGEH